MKYIAGMEYLARVKADMPFMVEELADAEFKARTLRHAVNAAVGEISAEALRKSGLKGHLVRDRKEQSHMIVVDRWSEPNPILESYMEACRSGGMYVPFELTGLTVTTSGRLAKQMEGSIRLADAVDCGPWKGTLKSTLKGQISRRLTVPAKSV